MEIAEIQTTISLRQTSLYGLAFRGAIFFGTSTPLRTQTMKHSLSASSRIVDFTLFILIVLVSSFSLSYSSTGGNQPWYYMSGGYGYGIPTTNVWGNNSQVQCNAPASVKGDPAWSLRNITGGEFHSMALINSTGYGTAFGNVVAWGDNTSGQCLGTDATGTAIVSLTADGTMPVQILGMAVCAGAVFIVTRKA